MNEVVQVLCKVEQFLPVLFHHGIYIHLVVYEGTANLGTRRGGVQRLGTHDGGASVAEVDVETTHAAIVRGRPCHVACEFERLNIVSCIKSSSYACKKEEEWAYKTVHPHKIFWIFYEKFPTFKSAVDIGRFSSSCIR